METTTIHPAEAYLRNEQNPTSLYVKDCRKTQTAVYQPQRKRHRHYCAKKTKKRVHLHRLGKH